MKYLKRLEDKCSQFIRWYGPARAFATAGSVVVVCVGAWWLLRAPAPPLENSLPLVSIASASDSSSSSVVGAIPSTTLVGVREVVVHVAGAVNTPGVYRLKPTARVIDAVNAAGGVTASADTAAVNLALPLLDAEQVYIPIRSSQRPHTTVAVQRKIPATPSSPSSTNAAAIVGATESTAKSALININTATALELEALPSVGPSTAKAIVAFRTKNGPFGKAEDLLKVPGIGDGKLSAMKPFVAL
ncbi:MAG: ComEA family DNA-binding protein [Actinobacteria bacterium]|nr:ComEA family DNA-binding protein [Actinomycetota bacterium]